MVRLAVFFLAFAAQSAAALYAPAQTVVLPPGSPFWIKSDKRVPLRVGQEIPAHLEYPIYADNQMLLPAGAIVHGKVIELTPDRSHRIQARLRGDFSPFSRPVVQFDKVQQNGAWIALPLGRATEGAPVMQLTPPAAAKGGLIRRYWNQGVTMVKDRVRVVTAPGKKDRLKDLLYSQLPYHPQKIDVGTVWTVDTTAVADLPAMSAGPGNVSASPANATQEKNADGAPKTWTLQAYLADTITSKNAKPGMPIRAIVAEPVRGTGGSLDVPQGALLEGHITKARPAGRFGRAGQLRFDFREIEFPGEAKAQQVQTTLAGVDAAMGANLAIDREGQVQPKPKDKVVVPFLLLTLAGRPLDRDRGDNAFGKDAVASNSLGVVGFIVGTAAGWRNVAAGIGYYGSAIAIWNRWIKRGEETTLRHDTRLVLQTTARRSAPLSQGKEGLGPAIRP